MPASALSCASDISFGIVSVAGAALCTCIVPLRKISSSILRISFESCKALAADAFVLTLSAPRISSQLLSISAFVSSECRFARFPRLSLIASETVESDAAKQNAAVETEDVDINVFMGDTAEAEIAAPAESAPSAKTDAESSVTEDVDIDSFMETAAGVPSPEDDIFAEPLQLGEPETDSAAHEEITSVDFDISAPNFLFLDEERKENRFGTSPKNEAVHGDVLSAAGKSKTVFGSSDPDGAVDAEDIEPIETDKGAVPFSFTSFASSEANIQNLSPVSDDVIVEGRDGVFSIASGIALDGVVQDEAFKRLVDSVIR